MSFTPHPPLPLTRYAAEREVAETKAKEAEARRLAKEQAEMEPHS